MKNQIKKQTKKKIKINTFYFNFLSKNAFLLFCEVSIVHVVFRLKLKSIFINFIQIKCDFFRCMFHYSYLQSWNIFLDTKKVFVTKKNKFEMLAIVWNCEIISTYWELTLTTLCYLFNELYAGILFRVYFSVCIASTLLEQHKLI